jgi:hypothetical protein
MRIGDHCPTVVHLVSSTLSTTNRASGDVKSDGRVNLAWYGVRPAIRLGIPGT